MTKADGEMKRMHVDYLSGVKFSWRTRSGFVPTRGVVVIGYVCIYDQKSQIQDKSLDNP